MQLFSPTGSRTLGRKTLRPRSAELCPAANTLPYLYNLQEEMLGVSRGYRIWDVAGENDVMCLCDRSIVNGDRTVQCPLTLLNGANFVVEET